MSMQTDFIWLIQRKMLQKNLMASVQILSNYTCVLPDQRKD